MKLRILKALLRKEIKLMKRNPMIPRIVFLMPVMVMLVVPLVANLDVKNVSVAVVDNDHSQLSRRIVSDINASPYLNVVASCSNHSEAITKVEQGDADIVVTIPPSYSVDMVTSASMTNKRNVMIDVEANGVNATKGMLGARYVAESIAATLSQWRAESGMSRTLPTVSVINRYNPTLDFRNYMIPALMVLLLIIICGFLPTLNLVGEKETGTIEAINVTPVSRFAFVLSKLIPFWLVGLLVVTVGMIIGWAVYGLIPVGNVLNIYLASILFSLVMSGLGVTIANKSATMLQSIFVMFAFIMIFQLMGGLFTPISSMPEWAQNFTYILPTRYYNEIMRAVYLKGTSFQELLPQFTSLGTLAAIACLCAAATYSKRR
ncbi:MAG: ABC transporter permease [Bacteroidales bacterium]|nr:ABC transporter permease [Bacteroidales bacterium]